MFPIERLVRETGPADGEDLSQVQAAGRQATMSERPQSLAKAVRA